MEPKVLKDGCVEFVEFSMKYTAAFPTVLKGVSLSVKSGEKVCVVGKSGSGKSSLFYTILRIVDGYEGEILLDGIPHTQLSQSCIRDNVSVIPQDPTVFVGTIKSNLDPFNKFSDEEIWSSIEKHGMKPTFEKFGLDGKIEENGKNLSVGELKLISMMRALIKNCKLLLVDECTSIDPQMDDEIQEIITKLDVTVISVTHKLKNMIFYDKVLVMQDGSVVEFDSVASLVDKPDSCIHKLICSVPNSNQIFQLFGGEVRKELPELGLEAGLQDDVKLEFYGSFLMFGEEKIPYGDVQDLKEGSGSNEFHFVVGETENARNVVIGFKDVENASVFRERLMAKLQNV